MYKGTPVVVILLAVMVIFLSSCATDVDDGWRDLLPKDLSKCLYKAGGWTYEDGALELRHGGYKFVWAVERYKNFILDLEFKVNPNGNSGIFIRTDVPGDDQWQTGIEVQISDSYGKEPNTHSCGAVYDCLAPSKNMEKKPGEWNHITITAKENKINVAMNGEQIIDMDLDLWTEASKNPDGTKNKFRTAYKDMPREGHIGFQEHGHPVWYRNIKIKVLED
jgi:hypothetical protein